MLSAKVEDMEATAKIDTGATLSYISPEFAKLFPTENVETLFDCKIANRTLMLIKKGIVREEIEFEQLPSMKFDTQLFIFEGLHVALNLGMDFVLNNKWDLNVEEEKIKFKGFEIEMWPKESTLLIEDPDKTLLEKIDIPKPEKDKKQEVLEQLENFKNKDYKTGTIPNYEHKIVVTRKPDTLNKPFRLSIERRKDVEDLINKLK